MWGESRGETMSKASNAVYKWRAAVRKTRILKHSAAAQHVDAAKLGQYGSTKKSEKK
jgi:hypothetical protein